MGKTVQELVHEQVAAKIAAGEELQRAVVGVESAQAALDDAEGEAAKARRAALKVGWTETELRSLGLASKTRSRRRGAATAAATPATDTGTGE